MKKYLTLLMLLLPALLMSLFLQACRENPTNTTNDNFYTGTVVDEMGSPVPGAELQIVLTNDQSNVEELKTFSDENGRFSIKKAKNKENYSILIKHPDFILYNQTLSDFEAQLSSPVVLHHRSDCDAVLRIKITTGYRQTELPGLQIRIERDGILIRKDSTNKPDNTYHNLCAGKYNIKISFFGCSDIKDTININTSDTLFKQYTLKTIIIDSCCNGLVYFVVRDVNTGEDPIFIPKISMFMQGFLLDSPMFQGTMSKVLVGRICKSYYFITVSASNYDTLKYHYYADCNVKDTIILNLKRSNKFQDSCCYGQINVEVTDSISGKKLSGIFVALNNGYNRLQGETTNSEGLVTFNRLCPGNYYLTFSSEDWITKGYSQIDFVINCSDTVFRKAKLSSNCCNGLISVRAIDSISRKAIDGVSFTWKTNMKSGSGLTANGILNLSKLCDGDYLLTNEGKKGLFKKFDDEQNTHLGCDDTSQLTFVLMDSSLCCKGSISGYVLDDKNNEPLPNVKLVLNYSFSEIATTMSDSQGNFRFDNVCQGYYTIKYSLSGYRDGEIMKKCNCSETLKDIRLFLVQN